MNEGIVVIFRRRVLGAWSLRVPNVNRMIFRRQDYRSDEPFMGRLSKHHDVILHTLLYVNGLVGHIISDVTSSRGRRHRVVHGDPRQV